MGTFMHHVTNFYRARYASAILTVVVCLSAWLYLDPLEELTM